MAVPEDGFQQITGTKLGWKFSTSGSIYPLLYNIISKVSLTKHKSSNAGMETLLNAPLHASQQKDKVRFKSCFLTLVTTTAAPNG